MRTMRDVLSQLRQDDDSVLRRLINRMKESAHLLTERAHYTEGEASAVGIALLKTAITGYPDETDAGVENMRALLEREPALKLELNDVLDFQSRIRDLWRAYNVTEGFATTKTMAEQNMRAWIEDHAEALTISSKEEMAQMIETELEKVKALVDPNNRSSSITR